jgi:hypothetical protein
MEENFAAEAPQKQALKLPLTTNQIILALVVLFAGVNRRRLSKQGMAILALILGVLVYREMEARKEGYCSKCGGK